MAAVGVAVNAFLRGDTVVGSGWLGRAQAAAYAYEHGLAAPDG